MLQWIRSQRIMGDDPPYLAVGTEVSAKYKGAFCEAKVRKVVRTVKCKVTFKQGLGTANVTDDQIRGTLRVGSVCEIKHPEKKEYIEGTINKIQDCSQYTVVFDDGDITTLRRTALCLKSGRHFAESETLDQLPLTHPEHFGNPVIGGRKGRRSRQTHEDSSDEEDTPKKGKKKEEKEADAGKVVCVELGDKKKQKDNWFPGLVVAPTAQDTVRIRVRDDYLVRSFKDGRYYTVPKKEANEFTREIGNKVDSNTLKAAVEKALLFLDRDELPPHWDRDLLFGMNDASCHSDSEGGMDSDSSDDEPREEKDHFVAQLYKFMDDRGTPINKGPTIGTRDVDLYKLFKVVHKLGGYNRVTNHNQWKTIAHKMGFGQGSSSITNLVKQAYKKFLHSFEDFYRKLGCTMVNHPRGNRSRHRAGRSLIRDRDRATPINTQKDKDKEKASASASSSASASTTSTEKSSEPVTKTVVKEEKKEDEKIVDEKKEKETISKVKEHVPKVKEQGTKTKEQPSKGKESALKLKDQTPKSKESVSKIKETPPKAKETGTKTKESITKTKEQATKGKEQASKAKEQPSKSKDQTSKAKDSLKAKESSKAKETTAKVKDPVPKLKDTAVKVKEPVLKGKGKIKEEKEHSIKEDSKPVKVKEEPIDSIQLGSEFKAVNEIKKEEKLKEEDLVQNTPVDDCEVTVVAEVKSKGRSRDLKMLKAESIETNCDKLKPDEKPNIEIVHLIDEKECEVIKTSEEKTEDTKKKVDKKTEDDDKALLQYTRSKSKEDLRLKKEVAALTITTTTITPHTTTITPHTTSTTTTTAAATTTTTTTTISSSSPSSSSSPPVVTAASTSSTITTISPATISATLVTAATTITTTVATAVAATTITSTAVITSVTSSLSTATTTTATASTTITTAITSSSAQEGTSPVREPDVDCPPHPIKKEDYPVILKKRGRKRKDADGKGKPGETLGQLASHIAVGVGDKLQVYYGPTHESKVTYEAKVLDIEEDSSERMYLVHYLGWNTRYDEWIKRGRIADNLSWTPSRAKRLRQQQAQLKLSKPTPGKRGRPSLSGRSQESNSSQQTPRSTTPSSVTSSSSRTNRSGTSPRAARNTGEVTPTGFEFRRRTRRTSGHTDISLPSGTESDEDDEYDSEPEVEDERILPRNRKERSSSQAEKDFVVEESGTEETKKEEKPLKKNANKEKVLTDTLETIVTGERMVEEEDEDDDEEEEEEDGDEEEDGEEEEDEELQVILENEVEEEEERVEEKVNDSEYIFPPVEILSTPPSGEKRRSKRCRKLLGLATDTDSEDTHEIQKTELCTEHEEEQPKGRDFDLNQIRSELKGIDKAVKLPVEPLPPVIPKDGDVDGDEVLILEPTDNDDEKTEIDEEIVVLEEKIVVEKPVEKVVDSITEDVYEFKEPEPFEFEVRTKRESLLSDERTGKVQRRPISRLLDMETKLENKPRKKLIRSPLKSEARDSTLFEGDVKKRFRRSLNKKSEVVSEPDKVVIDVLPELEPPISTVVASEPVTPQKCRPLSACEEAFDKLCESPSFHVTSKPCQNPSSPSILIISEPDSEPEPEPKTPELEQLSLLHDDGDDDDNEDRLVISETDDMETEIGEPLFSYPQRDHEELFPTLVSSDPSVPSVDPPSCSEQSNEKNEDPPLLSQINSDIFSSFTSALDSSSNGEKLSDVCKTSGKSDELGSGTDCGGELVSTSHSNVDVMNLYSMDDEFEDDPINAAIRRVMSQNIMDEDTNDMDIFGGKSALCGSFKQEVKPKAESPVSVIVDDGTIGKRKNGKKSVLSREFVESDVSDSDSSDEDQRLVIDKIDEESQPEEISNSSSVLSMKLPVVQSDFDLKTFEVKMPLNEPEDQSKNVEDDISAIMEKIPEENSSQDSDRKEEEGLDVKQEHENDDNDEVEGEEVIEEEGEDEDEMKEDDAKRLRLCLDPSKQPEEVVNETEDLVIPLIVDLDDNPKKPKPDPDPDPGPGPSVIILETPLPEVKDTKDIVVLEEPVLTTIGVECEEVKIEVKSEEESESNLLGSLLCQETIPGSPTQVSEACPEEAVEDEKVLLLEMPFASVPGSNCDPPGTVVATSVPVSVPEHLPAMQSPILSVPLCSNSPPPVVHPPSPGVSKRNSNEAAPVMDNTPPTTPDSTLSTISGSPREEHGDMSPALDNESTKSHRDSFEIDMDSCAEGTKVDHFSEDDSLLNVEVSNSCDSRLQGLKLLPKKSSLDLDKELESSPKKRRRSRKRSECDSNKRLRHSSGRITRNLGGGGSDSDDTSENSATGCMPISSSENAISSRSPRPSKYNFYVELAPELDGSQRIALLQQKLQELRKTYMNVKAELACIDRRRKKLRRREREEKATKQEVACS